MENRHSEKDRTFWNICVKYVKLAATQLFPFFFLFLKISFLPTIAGQNETENPFNKLCILKSNYEPSAGIKSNCISCVCTVFSERTPYSIMCNFVCVWYYLTLVFNCFSHFVRRNVNKRYVVIAACKYNQRYFVVISYITYASLSSLLNLSLLT